MPETKSLLADCEEKAMDGNIRSCLSVTSPNAAPVPVVIKAALSRFKRAKMLCDYNDGGKYGDGYSDAKYGDYSDHEKYGDSGD